MNTRQETGPLKIGDDWPGYFIRGDDALSHARLIRILAPGLDDPMIRKSAESYLLHFAAQLEECCVKPQPAESAA